MKPIRTIAIRREGSNVTGILYCFLEQSRGFVHAADQGNEVVIPLHPCLLYRIAVLAFSISNWLYDFAQLHNDVTKVQSFAENIAVEREKASIIILYAGDTD